MATQNKSSPINIFTAIEKYGTLTVGIVALVWVALNKNEILEVKLDKAHEAQISRLMEDVKVLKSDIKLSAEQTRICNEQVNLLLTKTVVESTKSLKDLSKKVGQLSRAIKNGKY